MFGVGAIAFSQATLLPDNPKPSGAPQVSLSAVRHDIEENHFAQAEAKARLALQHDANSADARYLLAYALMRQGKATEALPEYTRAAMLRKPNAEELRGVAQSYVLLGDYDDAEKWLKLSIQTNPKDADSWYNFGRLRYTQNRFADAAACFVKVLELAPRSVKAENNLGLAFEGLNKPADAEKAYRQAVAWQDAEPKSAASEQPLLNLGIILLHSNDPGQARPLLERAMAIAPKDPRIHEQLGQLDLRESRYVDAQREFKAAVDLDPGRSSLHFLLGQAYRRLGKQADATAEFAESARLSRVSPETGMK
jgi:Flp pilus assembly protein TadD